MKKDLNCSAIIKETQEVFSWGEDVHVMYYVKKQEMKRVDMRVHMNLICIVLQGEKEILSCGSKIIVAAGSGVFMKKGTYLVTDKVEGTDRGFESIIILFSDSWLRSQAESILSSAGLSQPGHYEQCTQGLAFLPKDELMSALTLQLQTCFSMNVEPKRIQSILPIKIRELFQILISGPGGHHFEMQLRSLDTYVNPDLMLLMQHHYKENLSLEQYAFLANNSLSTFKRKFMQTFKMNPGKWVMQRRLEEAYHLLGKSEQNVTEIAYEVGFESPAHFITSFKEKYGYTPKQLQQKIMMQQGARPSAQTL